MEAIGLVILGTLLLLCAPFGYFDASWKSPWHVARAGLLVLLLGGVLLALEWWW